MCLVLFFNLIVVLNSNTIMFKHLWLFIFEKCKLITTAISIFYNYFNKDSFFLGLPTYHCKISEKCKSKVFNDIKFFTIHLSRKHPEYIPQLLFCNECNSFFDRPYKLKYHLRDAKTCIPNKHKDSLTLQNNLGSLFH